MKDVKRGDDGNIEAVRVFGNVFLRVKDAELYRTHQVTEEETDAYFGDDGKGLLKDYLTAIANGKYSPEALKYDIMRYNELIG